MITSSLAQVVREHLAQRGITAVTVVGRAEGTVVVHPNAGSVELWQITDALTNFDGHAIQQPAANRVVVTDIRATERPDLTEQYAAEYAHHRAEADRLTRAGTTVFTPGTEPRLRSEERFSSDADMLAAAQVHATLALAAATMLTGGAR